MKAIRRSIPLVVAILFVCNAAPAQSGLARRSAPLRFSGSWVSATNGHRGLLKARVRQQDCCTYRVTFCGTFAGVIPFVYSVPMTVTGRSPDGTVSLYGRSQLPFYGEFTSHARMNGRQFNATYDSASDRGRFSMRRR